MKKSKILIPALSLASVGAVVTPMVTSCTTGGWVDMSKVETFSDVKLIDPVEEKDWWVLGTTDFEVATRRYMNLIDEDTDYLTQDIMYMIYKTFEYVDLDTAKFKVYDVEYEDVGTDAKIYYKCLSFKLDYELQYTTKVIDSVITVSEKADLKGTLEFNHMNMCIAGTGTDEAMSKQGMALVVWAPLTDDDRDGSIVSTAEGKIETLVNDEVTETTERSKDNVITYDKDNTVFSTLADLAIDPMLMLFFAQSYEGYHCPSYSLQNINPVVIK